MAEQPDPNQTVDEPDPLAAGLAAAFGPDSGPPLPADGSVIKALGAPPVLLREPPTDAAEPVLNPAADAVPAAAAARYHIDGEIARGGMGAILKGRDTDLGRAIAVKVLLETHAGKTDLVQRFVEEAQIAGQLQHPGIAPVYELGQLADKRPYFTMKLVKGKTLANLLAARKGVAEEQPKYLGIFAQVCQTLAYAHARGVIHRDLKPANIMVGAFGEVQVMDWGLAKVLREDGADDKASRERQRPEEVSVIQTQRSAGTPEVGAPTQAGSVLGTPAYMAPEQARGDVELVDQRADVFGLGAILCAILTGQPPFTGPNAEAMRKARTAQLADAFGRLDGCGAEAELIGLARRCLAAEPWDRPRDAGGVAAAVTAYQDAVAERLRQAELAKAAEAARAEEAQATAAQERRARRLTVALAASVVGTMLFGGGTWLWLGVQREAQHARVNRDVGDALAQTVALRERAQVAEGPAAAALATQARDQAQRAKALVEGGPPDAVLAERVQQLLVELDEEEKDRQLLAALDAATLAQAEANDRHEGFAEERAVPWFREAFQAYGLPAGEGDVTAVARRIRQRPLVVREGLLAALDEWIALGEPPKNHLEEPHLDWLRAVLAAAEPDGWRKQVRDATATEDPAKRLAALEELATRADVQHLPARALTRLAVWLKNLDAGDSAVALLRRAQAQYPGDFWINDGLGRALMHQHPPALPEAVRYLTAAVALRPDSAGARINLGLALREQGKLDEAIAEHRRATELDPNYAAAHNNLGVALRQQGKLNDAIAEFRRAIELDLNRAGAHSNLALALAEQGNLVEAVAEARQAVKLEPEEPNAYSNLGVVLASADQRNLEAAAAECRRAINIDPNFAPGHSSLGFVLCRQGRFAEAAASLRHCQELLPTGDSRRAPVSVLLALTERLLALEPKLPAVLAGQSKPTPAECAEYAQVCYCKMLYAGAAGLYADGMTADPKLADDLQAGNRSSAACCAALAGCGQGEDAKQLDGKERARLRKQAIDWLQADLAARARLVETGKPEERADHLWHLRIWQQGADLAGLRDPDAVAQLPADEQEACRKFWADVAELLQKAQEKPN
jgi:serine/threonine-protein kinase